MRILAWPAFKNREDNPYNYLIYTNMIKQGIDIQVEEFSPKKILIGHYQIWHLHWPDSQLNRQSALMAFFRVTMLLFFINIAKVRGLKLIWTAHNHSSHEKFHPKLEKFFWKHFLHRLDAIIHLSKTGQQQFEQKIGSLPGVQTALIPLGNYLGIYENKITRLEARKILGLPRDARVILFFGQIRPYKNVDSLIKAFRALRFNKKNYLLIAGKPSSDAMCEDLLRASEGNANILMKLEFIPDNDLQLYMNSADLVALPFTEIQNSASALLALSFGKPLLVPRKGAMAEHREMIGSEWVMTYDDELSGIILDRALDWAVYERQSKMPNLVDTSWDSIAIQHINLYRRIIA